MKTNLKSLSENNVRKTENSLQNVILKSLAVVISFVLISITVNAQSFWRTVLENSSFNEIAIALVETSAPTETPTEASVFATYLEVAEEELEMEEWMLNETHFATFINLEEANDKPLNMESWMTNENHFNFYSALLNSETEEFMELENWMTNENSFGTFINIEEATELPLKLESWMIEDNRFQENKIELETEIETPLELEGWMINNHFEVIG